MGSVRRLGPTLPERSFTSTARADRKSNGLIPSSRMHICANVGVNDEGDDAYLRRYSGGVGIYTKSPLLMVMRTGRHGGDGHAKGAAGSC